MHSTATLNLDEVDHVTDLLDLADEIEEEADANLSRDEIGSNEDDQGNEDDEDL